MSVRDEDAISTAVAPPLPSGPTLDSAASTGSTSSVLTATETLHVQEVERTRSMVRMCCALAVVSMPVVFLLGGDPLARRAYLASLVLVAVTTGGYAWLLRVDEGYSLGRSVFVGAFAVACAFAGIYYFGVFSAATAVLLFGLFFFSSSQGARATLFVYGVCALVYLALASLIMGGVIGDRGIMASPGASNLSRVVVTLLLEAVLFLSFINARISRQAALSAIVRHDVVTKRLAQREALLLEAKQELERALDFAGLGRFSDTTLGSFKLGKVIGRGAMGEVYEGAHVETGARAAVKLLHTHVLANPDIVKRFLREAKIAASLDVPNVVNVLEVGDLTAGLPFIAMERLEGVDLADHLREHPRLSVRKVSKLLRQIGRGLVAAHAAGIVHRDLKPRNVFLSRKDGEEVWKILDFGVSKLASAEDTQTHDRIVGTPEYMAPEQAMGKVVTGSADLFALGVIAYRALTGRRAFVGTTIAETVYQVAHTMPPRPSDLAPLHDHVSLVLSIAMAKSHSDRFESGEAFADALDSAASGELDPVLRAKAERILERHPWGLGAA
jgi:eukaryotic-like serine/threonine-protein kinase